MTRLTTFSLVIAVTACSDAAQVLTPPDAAMPEASVEASVDAAVEASPEAAPVDASSDVAVDAGCATGFDYCNGTCIDVTTYATDAKNCGFCGHDCLGNTCAASLCAVDLIGTNLANPITLAVDSTNVYFATLADSTTTSGSIYECPVTGCPSNLAPMTTGLNNPETLAVDSTTVYWDNAGDIASADGSVMSCPIAGCGTNDAKRKTLAKKIQFVLGLAVDSTSVYFGVWGATPYYGNGSVDACPLAGCTGAPPKVLTGQSKPAFIALDSGNVYMGTMGGGTGIPFIQVGAIPGPSAGTRIYSGNAIQDQLTGFAILGNTIYFSDGFANAIYVCPKDGCPTNPAALTGNTPTPSSIAADAKGIYWLDSNGIEFCATTGCAQPTLLATSTNFPQNIAINGSFVYWVEQDQSGTAGQVLRVAR